MSLPSFEGSKLFTAIHNPYCDTFINQDEVQKKGITSSAVKSYSQKIIDDRLKGKSSHFFANIGFRLFSLSYDKESKRAKEEFAQKKIAKSKEISDLKRDKTTLDYSVKKFLKDRKDRKIASENYDYNKKDNSVNSVLLNVVPEIFTEILCRLPKNNDIAAVLCTSKVAPTRLLSVQADKFYWETKTKLPYDSSIPFKEQMKMYKEIGIEYPPLINALGGLKKVHELPILDLSHIVDSKTYHEQFPKDGRGSLLNLLNNVGKPKNRSIESFNHEDMTHPIMRGNWCGRPFIAVRYFDLGTKQHQVSLFLRSENARETDWWHCIGGGHLHMNNYNLGHTTSNWKHDMLREKIILGRLNRLANYQKIGTAVQMPYRNETFKPEFPPYLEEVKERSPQGSFNYGGDYEAQPEPGKNTRLALWDPSKSKEENFDIWESHNLFGKKE